MSKIKTIILARVSTEEQREAGNSLDSQLFRLKTYATKAGLTIWKKFDIDESAYKQNREKFSKILDLIKTEPEKVALCCDKIDRLTRNFTSELVEIENMRRIGKLELHFPSDNIVLTQDSPASDLFRFHIGVGSARFYSDSIRDSVKRAFEQKLRRGEWPGKAPIGYLNVGEDNKKDIIPDPVRAPFISQAFEWYASGNYSYSAIVLKLDKAGLRSNTKKEKPLTKSQVEEMLKNPFYAGQMRYNGKLYNHRYQPIIKRWIFAKCQDIIDGRRNTNFKYNSKKFIFKGLVRCAHCGCMVGSDRKKGKYVYLKCNQYKGKCGAQRVNEDELVEQLYTLFEKLKIPEDVLKDVKQELSSSFDNEQRYHSEAVESLRSEYDRIEEAFSKLVDLRVEESITSEMYDNKVVAYKQRQADINEELDEHSGADQDFLINISYLLDLVCRARELFDRSKVEQKRALLNFLLSNCQLEGKKLVYNLKMPFDAIVKCADSKDWLPSDCAIRTALFS